MDMGLNKLTGILLEMAELAEKSVTASIDAYGQMQDAQEIAHQIYAWSEELRKFEDDSTEIAIEMIARFQPVAGDLRFIKGAMEIAYGFSRLGRYAYDIAEVLEMFGDLSDCDHSVVETTANTTKEMIRTSIEAFVKRDIELAKKVQKMDDFVDNQYRENTSSLLRNNNERLKCALSATLILRYLERMSDHSAYIGDWVIYIVTGEKEAWKRQGRPSILAESREER